MSGVDEEQRLLAYYGQMVGKSEDEVADVLLVGPKLSATLVSRPSVAALLRRGLSNEAGAVLQRHVLRELSRALALQPELLDEALWLSTVALLGASLDVAQPALDFVVQFGSVERLRSDATKSALERVAASDGLAELRVVEAIVRLASQSQSRMEAPVVTVFLQRLLQLLDSTDLLAQLSAVELLTSYVVKQPWTLQFLLGSGLHERAVAQVKGDAAAPNNAALLRLAGAIAAQSEDGFRAIERAKWLDIAVDALARPSEIPESRLDGSLSLLEGIARGSDAGRTRLLELLDPIVALVRGGDTYARVRGCHCLGDILECCTVRLFVRATRFFVILAHRRLSPQDTPASARVLSGIASAPSAVGLGAKLLSLAQQPLLSEQRVAVFRVLALLIEKLPKWLHSTTPSVLPYVINRHLDTEKDAVHWRYAMAQAFVAHGHPAALELLGAEQFDWLLRFLRAGVHGGDTANAKVDVFKEAAQ